MADKNTERYNSYSRFKGYRMSDNVEDQRRDWAGGITGLVQQFEVAREAGLNYDVKADDAYMERGKGWQNDEGIRNILKESQTRKVDPEEAVSRTYMGRK